MAKSDWKIAIVGGGPEARELVGRLGNLPGVTLVGWAEGENAGADPVAPTGLMIPKFADHSDLIRRAEPEVVIILTPHPGHYRPAMEALQAGCHVFLDRPLTAGVQEAVDIAGLAKGRGLKVAVGGTLRLLPSFVAARQLVETMAVGPIRLVTAASTPDRGMAMVDALLWTTGRTALEVAAFRDLSEETGGGMIASIRLSGGVLATISIPEVSPGPEIELVFHGKSGRLRATGSSLAEARGDGPWRDLDTPEARQEMIENFMDAITSGNEPCCPADGAVDSTRLQEAISRSAEIGQVVRLA